MVPANQRWRLAGEWAASIARETSVKNWVWKRCHVDEGRLQGKGSPGSHPREDEPGTAHEDRGAHARGGRGHGRGDGARILVGEERRCSVPQALAGWFIALGIREGRRGPSPKDGPLRSVGEDIGAAPTPPTARATRPRAKNGAAKAAKVWGGTARRKPKGTKASSQRARGTPSGGGSASRSRRAPTPEAGEHHRSPRDAAHAHVLARTHQPASAAAGRSLEVLQERGVVVGQGALQNPSGSRKRPSGWATRSNRSPGRASKLAMSRALALRRPPRGSPVLPFAGCGLQSQAPGSGPRRSAGRGTARPRRGRWVRRAHLRGPTAAPPWRRCRSRWRAPRCDRRGRDRVPPAQGGPIRRQEEPAVPVPNGGRVVPVHESRWMREPCRAAPPPAG